MANPWSGHIMDYKANLERAKQLGLTVSSYEAQYSVLNRMYSIRLRVHHKGADLCNCTLMSYDEDCLWSEMNSKLDGLMDDFESWK